MKCPESHPWAYNNGQDCCKFWHRNGDVETLLDWLDQSDQCGDRLACSDLQRKCTDNKVVESKTALNFLMLKTLENATQ